MFLKDVTEGKKCGNSYKQLSLEKLLIKKIELLKTKLSHKLPSKQNYLLSKTFTFDNSNSHCLEQIHFITLSFLGFGLLRVNCSCSHFFILASQLGSYLYLATYKISFSFSWIAILYWIARFYFKIYSQCRLLQTPTENSQ